MGIGRKFRAKFGAREKCENPAAEELCRFMEHAAAVLPAE
jgi:hypothetical protein